MSHTPGPWQWVVGPHVELILVAADYHLGDAFVLAPGEWGSGDEASDEANARLIAAAPELLEACRRLLKFNEELCADVKVSTHYPSSEFARAAIARADVG